MFRENREAFNERHKSEERLLVGDEHREDCKDGRGSQEVVKEGSTGHQEGYGVSRWVILAMLSHYNFICNYPIDKVVHNDDDVAETLEALERGGMVKDYNSNSTNLDSEDEEDPRTPASVSSQVSDH